MFFFFFFKQKTAYEMRISDWSSDVCSSDLDRHQDDQREPDVEQSPQDAADEDDLQQRRQNIEQHEGEDELDALDAALDDARQPPGTPVEMIAKAERVQMPEGRQ